MSSGGMPHHLRNYASAGLLSAIVGVVSFPIMTRNLSVEDYGIIGLIASSITLFIAVGKLGFQHSVIRFYAQVKNANIEYSLKQLNSTVFSVFFLFASLTTVVWLLVGLFVLPAYLQFEDISTLFLLASGIVFIRLLGSSAMNFLRAQQRSLDVATAQSISRILNLCMIIGLLSFSMLDVYTIISVLFVAEIAGVSYAAYHYRQDFYFSKSSFTAKLARLMLVYGIPLMILESLGLVLRLSDRYLIEAMLGVAELGQYSASYNFTAYLDAIVLAALVQAIRPAYMQLWESEGKAPTVNFLSQGFHIYLMTGIPFIAMFSITGPYLLNILAGDRYLAGTIIIPFVAVSFLIEGAAQFLAAGLYIFKNTKVLMRWSFIATAVNLLLNIVMIPKMGISGAAIVTVISYTLFIAGVASASFQSVRFPISIRAPFIMLVASIMVFVVFQLFNFESAIANFFIKGTLGTVLLLIVIWLIDPVVKEWLSKSVIALVRKLSSSS